MDWYKKDIVAYRRATRQLKPIENGIYERLLDEYYATESPLPNDVRYLSRVAMTTQKWESVALSKVLDQFFPLNGDGLRHNARADEEIADYKAMCDANRATARQRVAQRVAYESSTNRPPKEREIDRKKDQPVDKFCKHDNGNGTTCGKPGSHKIDRTDNWYCSGHPDG